MHSLAFGCILALLKARDEQLSRRKFEQLKRGADESVLQRQEEQKLFQAGHEDLSKNCRLLSCFSSYP